MKTGITTLIGVGALILSAFGQDATVETANTNAIDAVPAVITGSTNAVETEGNLGAAETTSTNVTELVGEQVSAKTKAAELMGPGFSIKVVRRLEAPDEIVSGAKTFKGPLVVFFKKQNPLAVFNPFRPELPGEKTERPLWDPYLGAPQGIVLFSLHR